MFFWAFKKIKDKSRTKVFHYQVNFVCIFNQKLMHLCSAAHNNNRCFISAKNSDKREMKKTLEKLHNQFWVNSYKNPIGNLKF